MRQDFLLLLDGVQKAHKYISSSCDPINLAASTFNNTLTLTFSSRIIERQIQKEFIRFLSNQGLSITIQTNDLEVEA